MIKNLRLYCPASTRMKKIFLFFLIFVVVACSRPIRLTMLGYVDRYELCIADKDYEKARQFVNQALKDRSFSKDERTVLRCLKLNIYSDEGDFDKAEKEYLKLYKKKPNNLYVLKSIGRLYGRWGMGIYAQATLITNKDKYLQRKEEGTRYFRAALPYLEKAREQAADKETLTLLRIMYYNLDMGKEFDKVDRELKAMKKE